MNSDQVKWDGRGKASITYKDPPIVNMSFWMCDESKANISWSWLGHLFMPIRVAEVAQKREGPLLKKFGFRRYIHYLVAILRFVAIYALFGRHWVKKVFLFWVKKCTITWPYDIYMYMVYLYIYYLLFMALNQICKFVIMRKNDAFVEKIAKRALRRFLWSFLRSPKGCQLLPPWCQLQRGVQKKFH